MKRVRVRYVARNKWYTRAFGCVLPNGNADEFPTIRKLLDELRVEFCEIRLPGGGAVFMLAETERRKLPSWEGRRMLPSRQHVGHGLWHITPFQIASLFDHRKGPGRHAKRRKRS